MPLPSPSRRASDPVSPHRAGPLAATVVGVARLALRRPRPVDVALTLACIVLMHLEIPLNAKADPSVLGSVAIVVASLPVLLRSQAPVLAYVLSFSTMSGVIATVSVYITMPAAVVLCAYAVPVPMPQGASPAATARPAATTAATPAASPKR